MRPTRLALLGAALLVAAGTLRAEQPGAPKPNLDYMHDMPAPEQVLRDYTDPDPSRQAALRSAALWALRESVSDRALWRADRALSETGKFFFPIYAAAEFPLQATYSDARHKLWKRFCKGEPECLQRGNVLERREFASTEFYRSVPRRYLKGANLVDYDRGAAEHDRQMAAWMAENQRAAKGSSSPESRSPRPAFLGPLLWSVIPERLQLALAEHREFVEQLTFWKLVLLTAACYGVAFVAFVARERLSGEPGAGTVWLSLVWVALGIGWLMKAYGAGGGALEPVTIVAGVLGVIGTSVNLWGDGPIGGLFSSIADLVGTLLGAVVLVIVVVAIVALVVAVVYGFWLLLQLAMGLFVGLMVAVAIGSGMSRRA